jgi:nucleotide-binding universal stress UspA family protein
MQQILAAIDFSEVSSRVLEQAARLAEAFSAELSLVHVAAPDPEFVGYDAGPESVRGQRAAELRSEHRELQGMAESLRERGLRARALLIQGPTVEKIVEEIGRLEADVAVLGSHGHGALRRALLGSVSEGVIRRAPCPVLVVPSRGAD